MQRVWLGLMLATLAGCSQTKETFLPRTYHSFVSLFNGYYHANERYKEALDAIEEQYEVPEEGLIPILDAEDKEAADAGFAKLDEAIEKCDVILYRHKNGSYVDNCHLLKGKAWYFKQNSSLAMLSFNYILLSEPETNLKPQIHYWKARTNYRMDNLYGAKQELEDLVEDETDRLREEGKLPEDVDEQLQGNEVHLIQQRKLRRKVALLYATLLLEEKQYDQAIVTLEKNMKVIRPAWRRSKVHFLLGQVYDLRGAFGKAYENYERVIKLNTNDELTFKAQLAIASLYIKYQPEDAPSGFVVQLLKDMLKDKKYEAYRDQIYYQFAMIRKKERKYDKAVELFREAIAAHKDNTIQLTRSYYEAGRTFFYNLQQLDSAQVYFAKAAETATEDFEEYTTLQSIQQSLDRYIELKRIIRVGDSLLALADLGEAEREEQLRQQILDEEKAKVEAARQAREAAEQAEAQLAQGRSNTGAGQGGGGFYFDNPQQVARGKMTFEQQWGDRPLEDHWRRSQKQAKLGGEQQPEEESAAERQERFDKQLQEYVDAVPVEPEAYDSTRDAVAEAHVELGNVFFPGLSQIDSAIAIYLKFVDRFQDHPDLPKVYYALYNLYKKQNNPTRDEYKRRILQDFPETIYARLLRDEVDNEDFEGDWNTAYTTITDLFFNEDYQTALQFSSFMVGKFGLNPDLPKVLYIRAMSYGYTGQQDSMVALLKDLITGFPAAEVSGLARRTLRKLNINPAMLGQPESGDTSATPGGLPMPGDSGALGDTLDPNAAQQAGGDTLAVPPSPEQEDEVYKGFSTDLKAREPVIGIVLVHLDSIKKDVLSSRISDFNNQNFKSAGLRVSILSYDQDFLLAYVTQFEDYSAANAWVTAALKRPELNKVMPYPENGVFFISPTNFRVAISQKRIPDYIRYFRQYKEQMLSPSTSK